MYVMLFDLYLFKNPHLLAYDVYVIYTLL